MAAAKKKSAKDGKGNARANGRKYADILYTVEDEVAWVTINRPRVLNAFREQTLDELTHALRSTREDPSIACAVITGVGEKAFSAGGDFHAMKRLTWTTAAMWNDRMLGLAMAIRGVPIPVIAMVNGWCVGGGHELALWCDLVIASENAVLGQTGARVGACPTVGATQYLPRIIGERLAREMIFCARRFGAKEAVEIGLINKCVPATELRKETLAWCETIKGHSPQTLRMTKKSSQFRIRSPLCLLAARHGAPRPCLGLGGEPRRHERLSGGTQTRLPEIPHAQQARAGRVSRRLRGGPQRAALDAQKSAMSEAARALIPPPARGRSTAFASLAKQMLSGGGRSLSRDFGDHRGPQWTPTRLAPTKSGLADLPLAGGGITEIAARLRPTGHGRQRAVRRSLQ